ncbi:MAG TPA: divalent-cation tolerance protein CutA [Gemmatimonadales bacterium]|jgi:periplasmic divalent cation tolerance protein|nr:divalent-cation tolerance protein CutA [Gemmatimonadales bacterium]
MPDEVIEVRTTVASRDDADRLARDVVAARLAACSQVTGPVTSRYWWKGTLERAEEWQCHFKTTRTRWPDVARFLREHHPYELPEIVMLPLAGSEAYLDWVRGEVVEESRGRGV